MIAVEDGQVTATPHKRLGSMPPITFSRKHRPERYVSSPRSCAKSQRTVYSSPLGTLCDNPHQRRGSAVRSAGMPTIRLATSDDIRRAARTASLAFADDPVMRWLVPDDEEYEANHQLFFGGVARRWLAYGTLWCTDDAVAIAGWVPPGRPEPEPDLHARVFERRRPRSHTDEAHDIGFGRHVPARSGEADRVENGDRLAEHIFHRKP